jgi:hypothetical protein
VLVSLSQTYLTSHRFVPIVAGSTITYRFQSKEGAILFLPEGASRQNLLPIESFRSHVRKHSAQWYQFARDCLPSAGSLFVVTGCDKTSSWGIAAASTTSGTVEISLKFTVAGIVDGSLSPRYQWKDFGSATIRTSRECSAPRTENQCIFIRGFVVPRQIPILTTIANKILARRVRGRETVGGKQAVEGCWLGIGDGTYVSTNNAATADAQAMVQEERTSDKSVSASISTSG